MRDELLEYYERELTYMRRLGAEFGRRYPRVASALQLEPTNSDDPHVERLLEGFAFLAARIHLKLDDEFPEITRALLATIYPEFGRPIPSMTLAQFRLDAEQGKLTTGYAIPRDTLLYSRPVAGVPCRFRTCYDTTLWPIEVAEAGWIAPHQLRPAVRGSSAAAALRLLLRCPADLSFSTLALADLRLHLSAEPHVAAALYELLCNNTVQLLVRRPGLATGETITLPRTMLRPVGFGLDEGVLPVPRRSFIGYRLLTEYFAFPEKFYFLDVTGLECLRGDGFADALELIFLISRFERAERGTLLESAVTADTIRLGCTPAVNLFPRTSEPVLLTQRRAEYAVLADARRRDAVQIYSVEEVAAVTSGRREPVVFEPLYAYRHGNGSGARHFWMASRRPRSWRAADEWDTYLSFADPDGTITHPDSDSVTARLLCYNANLPHQLTIGDAQGDFELPGGGPVQRTAALTQPTPVIQPPADSAVLWRLASLLSLNFVSLVEGGPAALQELLRLHNRRESAAGEKQIQAIAGLSASPAYARIASDQGLAFARGQRIELSLDEEQFAGGGVYLLASVLERFFGLYTSLNSFTMLHVSTRQRREALTWPPRAGTKALI